MLKCLLVYTYCEKIPKGRKILVVAFNIISKSKDVRNEYDYE